MISSIAAGPEYCHLGPRHRGTASPSIVRPVKIATIDASDAGRLGALPPADREAVRIYLRQRLSALG
jgi:hypothetical protein